MSNSNRSTTAEEIDAMVTNITRRIERYLKQEGAIKGAVNETPAQVTWPELEEAFDFPEILRSSILDKSDILDIELVTGPSGIYLGVPGEKARTINWQWKQAKARCRTLRRRLAIMADRGTLDEAKNFARDMGFRLNELPSLLEAAGHPLPQEVVKLLAPST